MTGRPGLLKRPGDLEAMREALRKAYPNLHAHVVDGRIVVTGTFSVRDGDREIDAYQIEIRLADDHPRSLPVVLEMAGRIPRTAAHHVNDIDGSLCIGVPDQLYLKFGRFELVEFLAGPVRDYLLGHSFFEQEGRWPGGEWAHGGRGLLQFYHELFGLNADETVLRLLTAARRSAPKWRKPCPCGSARRLLNCHGPSISRLRAAVPQGKLSYTIDQIRATIALDGGT